MVADVLKRESQVSKSIGFSWLDLLAMVADVLKRDVQCVGDDLLEGEYIIPLHKVEIHSFIAAHVLKVYKILRKNHLQIIC